MSISRAALSSKASKPENIERKAAFSTFKKFFEAAFGGIKG